MNARASKRPITVLLAAVASLPAVVGITVAVVGSGVGITVAVVGSGVALSKSGHLEAGYGTLQSPHRPGFSAPIRTPLSGLRGVLNMLLKQQPR